MPGEDPSVPAFLQMNKHNNHNKPKYRGRKNCKRNKKANIDAVKWIAETHRNYALNKEKTRRSVIPFFMSNTKTNIKNILIHILNRTTSPIDDIIKD